MTYAGQLCLPWRRAFSSCLSVYGIPVSSPTIGSATEDYKILGRAVGTHDEWRKQRYVSHLPGMHGETVFKGATQAFETTTHNWRQVLNAI